MTQRHGLVESRMRRKAHVRFGGRAEETDKPQGSHCASARPDHAWATLALEAGVHPKVVSARLGHSSVAFTLDVYSHAVQGLDDDAAARVADLILRETRVRPGP